jgi:hypothetical protein
VSFPQGGSGLHATVENTSALHATTFISMRVRTRIVALEKVAVSIPVGAYLTLTGALTWA